MNTKKRRKETIVTYHGRGFNPTEPKGRLSLAYKGIKDLPMESFTSPRTIKIFDLSHNDIVDFKFLRVLTELETLIIDYNNVTSHTIFPRLTKLEVLWVNENKIDNLALFIGNVVSNFPNLSYLSMMKNNAAPSYFNGGTKKDYDDYRYYVISQIPKLMFMDDVCVCDSEREEAYRMYGPRMRNSSFAVTKNGSVRSPSTSKQSSEKTPLLLERAAT